jgi:hypothetical protein
VPDSVDVVDAASSSLFLLRNRDILFFLSFLSESFESLLSLRGSACPFPLASFESNTPKTWRTAAQNSFNFSSSRDVKVPGRPGSASPVILSGFMVLLSNLIAFSVSCACSSERLRLLGVVEYKTAPLMIATTVTVIQELALLCFGVGREFEGLTWSKSGFEC